MDWVIMINLPRGYYDILVAGLSTYMMLKSIRAVLTEVAVLKKIEYDLNVKCKEYHFKLIEDYDKVMSRPD